MMDIIWVSVFENPQISVLTAVWVSLLVQRWGIDDFPRRIRATWVLNDKSINPLVVKALQISWAAVEPTVIERWLTWVVLTTILLFQLVLKVSERDPTWRGLFLLLVYDPIFSSRRDWKSSHVSVLGLVLKSVVILLVRGIFDSKWVVSCFVLGAIGHEPILVFVPMSRRGARSWWTLVELSVLRVDPLNH